MWQRRGWGEGGEGGLQVRAWSWNTLSSAEVQNGTLLTLTDSQNNPGFVSHAGISLSICVCVCLSAYVRAGMRVGILDLGFEV